jgi:hypothetical protein
MNLWYEILITYFYLNNVSRSLFLFQFFSPFLSNFFNHLDLLGLQKSEKFNSFFSNVIKQSESNLSSNFNKKVCLNITCSVSEDCVV